jgi:hypothetical protein
MPQLARRLTRVKGASHAIIVAFSKASGAGSPRQNAAV